MPDPFREKQVNREDIPGMRDSEGTVSALTNSAFAKDSGCHRHQEPGKAL